MKGRKNILRSSEARGISKKRVAFLHVSTLEPNDFVKKQRQEHPIYIVHKKIIGIYRKSMGRKLQNDAKVLQNVAKYRIILLNSNLL